MFGSKRRREHRERQATLYRKIEDSQRALLHAASTTADAAQSVTNRLRAHPQDAVAMFETTIQLLTDALVVCDRNGVILACNPAAEAIFARPSATMLHSPVTNLFLLSGALPVNHDALRGAIECNGDGHAPDAALRGLRATGEVFPVECATTRLDQSVGTLHLLLVRDISNLAALQQEASMHAQRSRAIMELSLDAILVVQDGAVVAANSAAGQLFGRTPEILLATPFENLVDPNSRDLLKQIAQEPRTFEVTSTRMDGTTIELIFASTSISWNDATATLLTVRDWSVVRGAEAARLEVAKGIDLIGP